MTTKKDKKNIILKINEISFVLNSQNIENFKKYAYVYEYEYENLYSHEEYANALLFLNLKEEIFVICNL